MTPEVGKWYWVKGGQLSSTVYRERCVQETDLGYVFESRYGSSQSIYTEPQIVDEAEPPPSSTLDAEFWKFIVVVALAFGVIIICAAAGVGIAKRISGENQSATQTP